MIQARQSSVIRQAEEHPFGEDRGGEQSPGVTTMVAARPANGDQVFPGAVARAGSQQVRGYVAFDTARIAAKAVSLLEKKLS